MTDLRQDLRDLFRSIMDEKFKNDPDDIGMLKTPIGELADAAADMVGALPSPPRYYPDEPQPSFSDKLTQEELVSGRNFSSLSVHYDEDGGHVVIVSSLADGQYGGWGLALDPGIAELFFFQGLAVVRHAREQAGN